MADLIRKNQITEYIDKHLAPHEPLEAVVRRAFGRNDDFGDDPVTLEDIDKAFEITKLYGEAAYAALAAAAMARNASVTKADREFFAEQSRYFAGAAKRMAPVVSALALYCAHLCELQDAWRALLDSIHDRDFEIRTLLAIAEAEIKLIEAKLPGAPPPH